MMQKINEAVSYIQGQGVQHPEIGIVLGTGLAQIASRIAVEQTIPYASIPHFPLATVESHTGNLLFGKVGDKKILAMQGRFHYYEGYSMKQITFPVRVMKKMGIKYLLLSNAAGGLNPNFKKGDLVMIHDHINLQPENPLNGKNIDELGPRFPDMSCPYSPYLNEKLKETSRQLTISLKAGVYVSVPGPNLETRSEYRFLRIIGGDMVGMSTIPEVIVANHMALPCAAVSVITDECDPENLQPVSLEEIIEVANKADKKLSELFVALIGKL